MLKNQEHLYTKSKGKHNRAQLFEQFKDARRNFDRNLRKYERQYYSEQAIRIENLNTDNPREFWRAIKRLGSRKKASIPMKVHDGDDFNTDPQFVLNHWKEEYEKLYNPPEDPSFDRDFYAEKLVRKEQYDNNPTETNNMVNREISYDEIEKLVHKAKRDKALGIDFIPNEVLKHHSVILALWNLFKCYFNCGKTPTTWLRAIIQPIPKGSCKDPYSPLQYRGISLLSNVAKIYSGFLNARIVSYCEFLDLFVDEQNGFRRQRSCEDHIFALTSLITKQLFAAFIDMEKAFDRIDRDLLMYRLLEYNIDGKMYRAIQGLYQNTESCIRINNLLSEWLQVKSG